MEISEDQCVKAKRFDLSFPVTEGIGACVETRSNASLALRYDAFRVVALTVDFPGKAAGHLTPVARRRNVAGTLVSAVDRNGREARTKFFPAKRMKRFGVVGGICGKTVEPVPPRGLLNGGIKIGRVIAGTTALDEAED